MATEGAFRFAYFTDKYEETCDYYRHTLGFSLEHSWDRSENDRGALFKAGKGLIEVLSSPSGGGRRCNTRGGLRR